MLYPETNVVLMFLMETSLSNRLLVTEMQKIQKLLPIDTSTTLTLESKA